MIKLKQFTTYMAVLAAAIIVSGSATVLARGGSDDSNTTGTTDSSQKDSSESRLGHMIDPEKRAEFRQKAEQEIEQKQAEREHGGKKSKSKEDRHKSCESHKQGLTTKFSRIVTNAQRKQAKIDKILDKATAYKDSSNLSPDNWDTLLAAAQAAKTTSATSIEDLQAITPTIDCNSDSVASDVATFKTAAAKARDDLKAYKTSVKALLKSLRDAKQAANTTQTESDGGTQ